MSPPDSSAQDSSYPSDSGLANPYQAPKADTARRAAADFSDLPKQKRGLVGHVRPIGVLMVVQGGLELLMGLGLLGLGIFLPSAIQEEMAENPGPSGSGTQGAAFLVMMLVVYGGLGLLNSVAGALHIYAGCRLFQFRSRTIGIVSLAGGCLTVLSCYCAPSAIALAVYGLIVLLNHEVTLAFAMSEAGYPPETVLETFDDSVAASLPAGALPAGAPPPAPSAGSPSG